MAFMFAECTMCGLYNCLCLPGFRPIPEAGDISEPTSAVGLQSESYQSNQMAGFTSFTGTSCK